MPRKNIKPLNGKPLIWYTISEAKKSRYIDRIVVSTDDKEIKSISEQSGAEVPYLRPSQLSSDDSPTIDCVIHMLNWLKEKENYDPSYVCLLQCTSPLRDFIDIDSCIEKAIETNMDGAISVCEAEVNPYWTNIFDDNKLKYFIEEGRQIIKRQDLPKIYRINGAVYTVKTDIIKSKKSFETDNMNGYVMSGKNSIDIDNELDFKLAELIILEKML